MPGVLKIILEKLERGRNLALLTSFAQACPEQSCSEQSGPQKSGFGQSGPKKSGFGQSGYMQHTAGIMLLVGEARHTPEIIWGYRGRLLESQAVQACREIMEADCPRMFDFDVGGRLAAATAASCQSASRVLIEPITMQDYNLFQSVEVRLKTGEALCVASSLSRHDRWILEADGAFALPPSNPDREVLLTACQNCLAVQVCSPQVITAQFDLYCLTRWGNKESLGLQ